MTGADDMDGMDRLSIKADRSGIVVYVPAAMSVKSFLTKVIVSPPSSVAISFFVPNRLL